jgi:GNAT superfamily N-acetyltransferase
MTKNKLSNPGYVFHPLTTERWPDFEKLFGPKGAYAGCWCMWWRISRKTFEQQQGEGNRLAMQQLVASGEVPGILAYSKGSEAGGIDRETVGWCSVAPRSSYASLNRSRVLKQIDDIPVWSIVCFFIDKSQRGKGLTLALIQAALDYVRQQGGQVVEAYPTLPKDKRLPPVSSFMGLRSVFEAAGFVEVARPSQSKVIMRHYLS